MSKNNRYKVTRELLLKTALQLILEEGLAKFSLRGLARKTNYSPAGLYEYFKNKEQIITELSSHGFEQLSQYIKNKQTCDKDLFGFGMAYLTFAQENPELYRLIFNFVPSKVTSLGELIKVNESFFMLNLTIKAALQDKVSDSQYESLAFSYWSLLHGLSILPLTIIHNYTTDFIEINKLTIQIFIDGLLTNKQTK